MRFLITTLTSWDEIPRARHQVTDALIRAGHQVVFIEKNKVGVPCLHTRDEKPGLVRVTPDYPLDYRFRFRLPIFNEIYQLWLFKKLHKKYGDIIAVNFDYTAHLLHYFFKQTIYYCNDEYIGNSKYPCWIINVYHRRIERKVAGHAIFCVATASHLTNKLSKINAETYEIPLGGPAPRPMYPQKKRSEYPLIRVGLMGTIKSDYVCPRIINKLLTIKEIQLVFIGHVEPDFMKKIDGVDRIEFKGVLTGEKLYREMVGFDVAIAPYDISKINMGGSPNKIFQYMACACPVVVSAIPFVKEQSYPEGTVYVAETPDDFVHQIQKAYAEECDEFRSARLEFAGKNTWESRITDFLSILSKHNL